MQQGNTAEKPATSRLTGAWERSGKYGTFFVGKTSLDEINKAVSLLGNDIGDLEIIVSPVTDKKSDKSPDVSISFRLPREVDGSAQSGTSGAPSVSKPAGFGGTPRRPYGGKK